MEGGRLIEAVEAALEEDAHLLKEGEGDKIAARIDALREVIAGDDHRRVTQALEALNHATESFAARRMDASVNKALTGQKLEELEN